MRAVVLGAGVSGLYAADRLAAAGWDVTVVEASARIGGAHRSTEIGNYTFDAGSIFYEEGAALLALAPGLREACPPVRRVQRRLAPDGALLHYPLGPRDLRDWPAGRLARTMAEIAMGRILHRRDGSLRAVMDQRLGRTLPAATGLTRYVMRFNHQPLDRIDEAFFTDRMGFVERHTRLAGIARRGWDAFGRGPAPRAAAPLRVRPSEGFAALWDPVRAALEARGVRFALGHPVKGIAPEGGGHVVTAGGQAFPADRVIGAMPVDALHRIVAAAPSGLRSLDLMTLFVSAGRLRPEAGNVLFNFHPSGRWKRATVYSRLYPERMEGREFMAVEVTLPPGVAPDPGAAFADLSEHLAALGVAGDLRLEGHDLIEAAYPLYELGFARTRADAIKRVVEAGVNLVGRQGRFDYLPTSSRVIRRTREQLDGSGLPASQRAA